jgi:hypothetical protein
VTILDIVTADIDTLRGFALVFAAPLAEVLEERWMAYGSPNCQPVPRTLTDGRYMLAADILSETRPGGLLEAMWEHSDKAAIAAGVTVMPWADAVALLPPDPPHILENGMPD